MAETHEGVDVFLAFVVALGISCFGQVGEVLEQGAPGCAGRAAAQLCERGLDLGTFQKPLRAADAKRDRGAAQRLLERGGLGVRAVEHGHVVPPRAEVMKVAQAARDGGGLGGVVGVFGDARIGTVAAVGAQRECGPPAVGEECSRGRDDLRRRAVVVPEADDLRSGEVARELCLERLEEGDALRLAALQDLLLGVFGGGRSSGVRRVRR